MNDRPWELHCGDGVEGLLAHGPVDHVITDPPYAEEVDAKNRANRVRDNEFGFAPMDDDLRNRTARAIAMQTRRWALVFCSMEEAYLWRFALAAAGMSYYRTGLYVRTNTQPQQNGLGPAQAAEAIVIAHSRILSQSWNGGGKAAIWEAPIVRTNRCHPTQKPDRLMRELVQDFTNEGETIADLFTGSGTTGAAAVGLGRRFVGWELDPKHYETARGRLAIPLFERPVQIDLPKPSKGIAARRRMELDIAVLTAVSAAGRSGIQLSGLAAITGESSRDIQRALKRLQKRNAVVREGTTSSTHWFDASTDLQRAEL